MKPSADIVRLDDVRFRKEIRARLRLLSQPTTQAVRQVRKEFSCQIAGARPEDVVRLALNLLEDDSGVLRFFAYELVSCHGLALKELTTKDLLQLGRGLNSWSSVDCFAMYLSGPMLSEGRLSEEVVTAWARGEDRWWRRSALVSTVALSRRGKPGDLEKVVRICTLLVEDRDDMVVKALSWALREAAKKHPEDARKFLARHKSSLAARVIREVNHKLRTGVKSPRRSREG
jgi:3-methyladenine DNA glycosylase AlkD